MDGHPQDAADGEEEEGDDDEDGDVPPHVVLQFVVGGQLEEATTEETPGEETFLGGADPGLEDIMGELSLAVCSLSDGDSPWRCR